MNIKELEDCIYTYGKDIFALCKQLTSNNYEAEELYQDTFVKAIELKSKIDKQHNPRSYLASITIRLWNNKRRKYAWRQRIASTEQLDDQLDTFPNEDSLEEIYLHKEQKMIVQQAIKELSDKYKVPIYLYYILQLSIDEIARILKKPKGTIKSRLHKARQLLKEKLEVIFDEEK